MLRQKFSIHPVPVFAIMLALFLTLAAPAVAETKAAPPPMPNDVQMVQPDPKLPKELAAFAGKWEGSGYEPGLNAQIQMFVIVEKIAKEKAGLYVYHPSLGWNRREATVTKEGGKYKLSFIGSAGRNEITSTREGLVFDAKRSGFTINLKRFP